MQLTDDVNTYGDDDLRALRDYLDPVLMPGAPRPAGYGPPRPPVRAFETGSRGGAELSRLPAGGWGVTTPPPGRIEGWR